MLKLIVKIGQLVIIIKILHLTSRGLSNVYYIFEKLNDVKTVNLQIILNLTVKI